MNTGQVLRSLGITLAAFTTFAATTSGCAEPTHRPNTIDAGPYSTTDADASDDAPDVGDDSDAHDSSADGAGGPDVDSPDPVESHPRPPQSTYVCDESNSVITYKSIDDPFVMPEDGYSYEQVTIDIFREKFGDSGARGYSWLAPGAGHQAITSRAGAFAARSGEDVVIRAAMWARGAPFEGARVAGTVLVEYQPVEATYQVWDEHHQEVLHEVTSTGLDAPARDEMVLVDITIPSENLPQEKGAFELSVFLQLESPGESHFAFARRMFVFYGGYSRPSHPCFPNATPRELTEEEETVIQTLYHTTSTHLYPQGETGEAIRSTHHVAPGSTVQFDVFKNAQWTNIARPTVLQPLLNGRPVGDPIYIHPTVIDEPPTETVLHQSFEVKLPEEPGLYHVTVAGFEDAHLLLDDHHGARFNGVLSSGISSSSNSVWYEVVEAE